MNAPSPAEHTLSHTPYAAQRHTRWHYITRSLHRIARLYELLRASAPTAPSEDAVSAGGIGPPSLPCLSVARSRSCAGLLTLLSCAFSSAIVRSCCSSRAAIRSITEVLLQLQGKHAARGGGGGGGGGSTDVSSRERAWRSSAAGLRVGLQGHGQMLLIRSTPSLVVKPIVSDMAAGVLRSADRE